MTDDDAQITVPQTNALHQTGRGGVAIRSMGQVVEARPAGEREC